MTREELIRELNKLLPTWYEQCQMEGEPDMSVLCADFILSRERLLLEKIGNVRNLLQNIKDRQYRKTITTGTYPVFVDEALAIIEKEGL